MTVKLSGPMVPPKSGGLPKQAVVLLHGYGATGEDLIGLAGYWRDILPDGVFLLPNAPEPCRDNPEGYQWFAIDYSRGEHRFDGAPAARAVVTEFLHDLWQQTKLDAEDTILAGFSQGGMMSLDVGLSLDVALMGVISFSGALIAPPGPLDHPGPKPPICLVHGDRDGVVEPRFSEEALTILKARGFSVDYHVEKGAAHAITEDGLEFAGEFIARVARRS